MKIFKQISSAYMAIRFLFLGFATCFGAEKSRRAAGRVWVWSSCVKFVVDAAACRKWITLLQLYMTHLGYRLGDVVLMILVRCTQNFCMSGTCDPMLARYNI
jgi:hypothetical protein